MAKGPGGQPTKYNREFHNKDFIEQSRQGRHLKQIAAKWDVARSSLYEWANKHVEFSDTIKRGQELCEAWYANLGQAAIMGQAKVGDKPIKVDLGFYVWMTKNICKWSDKTEHKDATPVDKKRLTLELDVSDEQLDNRIEKLISKRDKDIPVKG